MRFRIKRLSRFVLQRKKFIVLFVLVFVILALYLSDSIMIEIPNRIVSTIHGAIGLDFTNQVQQTTTALLRFGDEINIFKIKKNLLDGAFPVYNLELSGKVIGQLDNISKIAVQNDYMTYEDNPWHWTTLTTQGREYKVRIRLHGDSPRHWAHSSKSYKVKTRSEEYLNNIRRFNLIVFEDRLLNGMITRMYSSKLGLFDVRDDVVVLTINGVIQGLYYLQEDLDYDFLEYNECSNCEIIKTTDNINEDHPFYSKGGIYLGNPHISPFDYEISNINLAESYLDKTAVLYEVGKLFDAIEAENSSAVLSRFDIDYISSFEALRLILGSNKMASGDDLKFTYRATNSKFYPIPITEVITKLDLAGGGFESYLSQYDGARNRLFYLIEQDDLVRYLRNKKAYALASSNDGLTEIVEMVKQYRPYATSYNLNILSSRQASYIMGHSPELIQHNFEVIRKSFEYAKAYVNIFKRNNEAVIEVIADSVAELVFEELVFDVRQSYDGLVTLNYGGEQRTMRIRDIGGQVNLTPLIEGLFFGSGLDENLNPITKTHSLSFVFENEPSIIPDNVSIIMRNDITNKQIPPYDIYIQLASDHTNLQIPSLEELQAQHPQIRFTVDNNVVVLKEGNYLLQETLIIPRTDRFVIEQGTILRLDPNVSILSYSPLHIAGTPQQPVIISAASDEPYGTIAVVGEEKDLTVIDWLDISGGSEQWINGMFFSGQLSLYHTDVILNNSRVHGSMSDDGINVKYGDVVIDNSLFYDNAVDQADLDFVTGTIKKSKFLGKQGIIPGDGIDLSGSEILIKQNEFSQSADKGVSIGEKSKVILYQNVISENKIGIASKDLSQAYLFENEVWDNDIAISNYQKKQLFGGGNTYLYKNVFVLNNKKFQKDNQSSILTREYDVDVYSRATHNFENDKLYFFEE